MPVQVTYPGVYIQEAPSGVRTITGVATSIAAFIGMTPGGPILTPTRVQSYREYENTFRTTPELGEMGHQVRQFFLNEGQTAWITRIAANVSVAANTLTATSTLANDVVVGGAATPVLTISAREAGELGNNIRVEIDYDTPSPERTFNLTAFRAELDASGTVARADVETHLDLSMNPSAGRFAPTIVNVGSQLITITSIAPVPGVLGGLSQSGLVFNNSAANTLAVLTALIDPTHNKLQISVNNSPFVTVTVPPPSGTAANFPVNDLQAAINSALTLAGITAVVTAAWQVVGGGRSLRIASTAGAVVIRPGNSDDVTENLQFGVSRGGLESDAWSVMRPAPTGYTGRAHGDMTPATRVSRILLLAAIDKNTFGLWHLQDAVGVSNAPAAPFAGAPAGELMYVGAAFALANTAGSLRNVADNLGIVAASIEANTNNRWKAEVHGYRLALIPRFGNQDSDTTARLTDDGGNLTNPNASFANAIEPFNVAAYSVGLPVTAGAVYRTLNFTGSNGSIPLPADYLAAFEQLDRHADIFNIMILPRADDGTTRQTDGARSILWANAGAFCKGRRAFLLVDPPSDTNAWPDANTAAAGIVGMRSGLTLDYAAIYWPRVRISDPSGKTLFIDPAGTLAGLYASTDNRRGVWKAPAGIEGNLIGVFGLEHAVTDKENGVTNPQAVNTLRMMTTGAVSWGARTMVGFDDSGNSDWKYIPVRRIALFIEESLYRGLRFAVFEPNAEPLWAQIRLAAGAFMNNLFRQGAFKGERANLAYFVACDSTTTTPNDINLGIVNVEVGFAPLKPAEFVIITIRQMAGQIQV